MLLAQVEALYADELLPIDGRITEHLILICFCPACCRLARERPFSPRHTVWGRYDIGLESDEYSAYATA